MPHQPVAPASISPAPTKAESANKPGPTRKPSATPSRTSPPAASCTCRISSSGWRRSAATSSPARRHASIRSEEHTSEFQSLMRNSYAVFCLEDKLNNTTELPQMQIDTNKHKSEMKQKTKHK